VQPVVKSRRKLIVLARKFARFANFVTKHNNMNANILQNSVIGSEALVLRVAAVKYLICRNIDSSASMSNQNDT